MLILKRPILAFAAAWTLGLCLCGIRTAAVAGMVMSYMILVIILCFVPKISRILVLMITPKRYRMLSFALVLMPLCFVLGWVRGGSYQKQIEQSGAAYHYLYEKGERECFVVGTVRSLSMEEEELKVIVTDCRVCGYEQMEFMEAGNCEIRIPKEVGKTLKAGNRIRVYGKLGIPKKAANAGQFDAFSYHAIRGVFATIRAIKTEQLNVQCDVVAQGMYQLKEKGKEILQKLYEKEDAGVLTAMLMGDKELLPEEIKKLYQSSGISHVLAISGLHISMLAMGLYRLLVRIAIPPAIRLPATAAFLILYVYFSGGSTSAWRAAIMCLCLLTAKAVRRSYDMAAALAIAAIVLTLKSPWELRNAGFLLSFGAVLGVILAQKLSVTGAGKTPFAAIAEGLRYSGMITCMTMPVSLWFFYEISVYSVFLNLLILPFVSVILSGGLCSVAIGMFSVPLAFAAAGGTHMLLGWYELVCRGIGMLPFSMMLVGRPQLWQMIGYYGCFFLAVSYYIRKNKGKLPGKELPEKELPGKELPEKELPGKELPGKKLTGRKLQGKKLSGTSMITMALMAIAMIILFIPQQNRLSLNFLDVSQGDCTVITTRNGETIVFDCGSTDVSSVGEYRLKPYLKQRGCAVIDVVCVSHMDADHMNGVEELLMKMPVYRGKGAALLWYRGELSIETLVLPKVELPSDSYLRLQALAREKQVTILYLEAGGILPEQDPTLQIDCLSPRNAKESENETSLVLLLRTKELEAWLMADADTKVEMGLAEQIPSLHAQERFCILKAGHHGSKTATSELFVKALTPDGSILSCGYQNRYGHPHTEVIHRLEAAGSKLYYTMKSGQITIEADGGKIRVKEYLKH